MMPRRHCPANARPAIVKLALALVFPAICAPVAGVAQTPFALRALGQNIENDSARDTGRGGWGMAAGDTLAPGTRNPASLASLRHMGLVVSGFGETAVSSGGGLSRTTRGAYLPNVRLGVPLHPGRLVLHAGFNVQRSMKYETVRDFEFDHLGETVIGSEGHVREGTLYAIPMGLSWRVADALAIGGTVNLVRGVVTDRINQVYTDPGDGHYLPNVRESRDELSGTSMTLALLWDGLSGLQAGASVTTGYDLDVQRSVGLGGVAGRAEDRYTGSMPPQYRAGLQVKVAGDWRFGADGQLARYSSFSGVPAWESVMRDEWTVAAGFERVIVFREHGRGYLQPWRFGYQQRQWAHAAAPPAAAGVPLADGAVREHAISAGTGFPFRNRMGSIDLALSYVWAGSETRNGWSSRALRFGVSIVGLERLVF